MLSSKSIERVNDLPVYGDLSELNQGGLILSSIGQDELREMASEYLDLLETSSAIYEVNGDYALGLFSSGWCQMMDAASRRLCETDDNLEALKSGRWLCHECCWKDASLEAINADAIVDIECTGGINLYAVPIHVSGEVVGVINFGYGNPPTDDETLGALARDYHLSVDELRANARAYRTRPSFIIDYAKKRIQKVAGDIGSKIEQVQSEQARLASERLYSMLFSASPLAIISIDAKGVVQSWNPAAERMFGWSEAEVLGTMLPIVVEEQRENFVQLMNDYQHDESYSQIELQRIRKDGSTIDVRLSTAIIKDEVGQISSIIGIFDDITEQKHQAEAMRKTSQELNAILDHSPLLIIEIDLEGTILLINQAVALFYNKKPENLEGVQIYELLPDDAAISLSESVSEIISTGAPIAREDRLETPIGERVFLSTVFPLFDSTGQISSIGSITRDITERKIVEDETRRLKESLEATVIENERLIDQLEDAVSQRTAELQEKVRTLDKSQKAMLYMVEDLNETKQHLQKERRKLAQTIQELEAFSYSVSHDLRAPLRHINGYIDLLVRRFPDSLPEQGQHYLDNIVDSANEMGKLIDDLLQFSRTSRQEMQRSKFDMNDLVQEVQTNLKPDYEQRDIVWQVDPLPVVYGDRGLLKLVWLNLLGNALKFTHTQPQARVEIGYYEDQNELVFFVRDNGVGFDMKYSHKLFGVFQRLHGSADFPGTGIGLANLRRIVQRHGGRTWAEGEEDKGAIFYFSLPILER